ncbi:MAG: ComEC/Rec2 family competence protein [Planctomycetota bacterium]|jgi:competence protein ComEC
MDPIQRKLELIDKQLAGRDLHGQLITTAPLFFAAAGLIVGIVLQSAISPITSDGQLLWLWALLSAVFTVAALVLFAVPARKSKPKLLAYLASSCFVCLGAIRLISFNHLEPDDISRFVGSDSKPARIRGVIITEPYVQRHSDWAFAKFKFTDPASSFYLKLTEAKTPEGWARLGGTVRVRVDGPVLDLKAGDYVEAYSLLERFKPATNPGQFDTAAHLAGRNVFVAASVKSRDGIELLRSPPTGAFTRIRATIRQAAARALLGGLPADGSGRGMLQALLLGYRGEIDSATYRAFRKTGLLHFVSLSGLHFGILVGIVWWLCKTAGLMKRGRALVCIFAIALFLMVVPARAPTLRAAIIGWIFCASLLFRRNPNSMNTLSLAAIILLLIRPSQLFEAGWQLSFGTVFGILLLESPIKYAIKDAIDRLADELDYREFRRTAELAGKLPNGPVAMFSVGLAAWLGGAGILLYHFGEITPMASLWTVLVFPLVGAILTLGFAKMLLFFLLPTLAAILGVVVTGLSEALIWFVKLIGFPDFLHILIGHVPLWPVVVYYCFVGIGVFARFRRPVAKKAVCAAMAIMMFVILGPIKWRHADRTKLVLTCLNVSHGQAIVAEFPGGDTALFDAGSLNISDVGRRTVAPFLDYKGISRIDTIFISHNDIDHINGIPEVARHCRVGCICANEAFFEDTSQWGAARLLGDSLKELGLEIAPVAPGAHLAGNAEIENIWPIGQSNEGEAFSENDRSQVSLMKFAGRKILLCSDIEKAAQKEILRLYPDLKADIVIVPHHGSRRTADAEFLKTLDPEILMYSCGRREYESRREMKHEDSARHLFTPYHGAITVSIGKDGSLRVETAAHRD